MLEEIKLGNMYLYVSGNTRKHIFVPVRFEKDRSQREDVIFYIMELPDKEEIGSLAWAKKYWSEIK